MSGSLRGKMDEFGHIIEKEEKRQIQKITFLIEDQTGDNYKMQSGVDYIGDYVEDFDICL